MAARSRPGRGGGPDAGAARAAADATGASPSGTMRGAGPMQGSGAVGPAGPPRGGASEGGPERAGCGPGCVRARALLAVAGRITDSMKLEKIAEISESDL